MLSSKSWKPVNQHQCNSDWIGVLMYTIVAIGPILQWTRNGEGGQRFIRGTWPLQLTSLKKTVSYSSHSSVMTCCDNLSCA